MDNGFPILGKFPSSIHHHTFVSPLFVIVNIFSDDYSDDQAFRQLESLLDDASNQLPVLVTPSSHILPGKRIYFGQAPVLEILLPALVLRSWVTS